MTDDQKIRMQYLGVLTLLGNVMAYVRHDEEGQEYHDLAAQAYDDAIAVIPNLRVRRTISRYDLDLQGT